MKNIKNTKKNVKNRYTKIFSKNKKLKHLLKIIWFERLLFSDFFNKYKIQINSKKNCYSLAFESKFNFKNAFGKNTPLAMNLKN